MSPDLQDQSHQKLNSRGYTVEVRAIQSPLIRLLQNAALLIRTRRWKYMIGLAHVAPTAAILAATALIYL